MNREEEFAVSEHIRSVTKKSWDDVDEDTMEWVSWMALVQQFNKFPQNFALDLTISYFRGEKMFLKAGLALLEVINADSEAAVFVEIAGGKGSNIHILRKLAKATRKIRIPETSIVTTAVYQQYVLENPEIGKLIKELDAVRNNDEKTKEISKRIRWLIEHLELPLELQDKICREFDRLGGNIAVRSSATVEDLKEHAAAGEAESFLRIKDRNTVVLHVKKVWASLFLDGFVTDRNMGGIAHKESKMAVLLQTMVKAKAAGVATSIHPATGRPVYNISAQLGYGEALVQGQGVPDQWLVGLMGDMILERQIGVKKVKIVDDKVGGVRKEAIHVRHPSLSNEEVLFIGQSVRIIYAHYLKEGLARNIDVEFVVDEADNSVVVVQTALRGAKAGYDKEQ